MIWVLLALSAAFTGFAVFGHDYLIATAGLAIPAAALVRRFSAGQTVRGHAAIDSASALETVLLVWQLGAANFDWFDPVLFPAPETILRLFCAEFADMSAGLLSSLYLLGSAYILALITAIPAGLLAGSSRRIQCAVEPFSKVLGAVPPIVYIPYAIALLPSFRAASIFVIWSGTFWPVFVNTVSGVANIPDSLLDSAKMLHLKKTTFIFRVLLPGAMPSILTGASLGLVFSFLLLTAAELIGATEGLGWYVKNFSDFADYGRVIVGIIFIGLVITVITWGFKRIERMLLRYREECND